MLCIDLHAKTIDIVPYNCVGYCRICPSLHFEPNVMLFFSMLHCVTHWGRSQITKQGELRIIITYNNYPSTVYWRTGPKLDVTQHHCFYEVTKWQLKNFLDIVKTKLLSLHTCFRYNNNYWMCYVPDKIWKLHFI